MCLDYSSQVIKIKNYLIDEKNKEIKSSLLSYEATAKYISRREGCQFQE